MLNANINPNIIARIPTIILKAENPDIINAIPKTTKLAPIRIDNAAELKIGKIIKNNPKIMDNIPDILFGSMFFSSINLLNSLFKVKNIKIQKAICFHIKLSFS